MLHDDDQEDDVDEEYMVDIDEQPIRSTIPISWMDEPDPAIAFGMRRRPIWSDAKYEILHK